MEELELFWKDVDEMVDMELKRYTDIEIQRTKHDCMWNKSECVIYTAEKIKIEVQAKVQNDDVSIQLGGSFGINQTDIDWYTGKIVTNGFKCSDLSLSVDNNVSFRDWLCLRSKWMVIIMAVQYFCRTEVYHFVYDTDYQNDLLHFIIFRPGSDAKLRIHIGATKIDSLIGSIAFYERFFVSITKHPVALCPPAAFSNTGQLCRFMKDKLTNKYNPTISQLLEPSIYWGLVITNLRDCPSLSFPDT